MTDWNTKTDTCTYLDATDGAYRFFVTEDKSAAIRWSVEGFSDEQRASGTTRTRAAGQEKCESAQLLLEMLEVLESTDGAADFDAVRIAAQASIDARRSP